MVQFKRSLYYHTYQFSENEPLCVLCFHGFHMPGYADKSALSNR
jgi:hypothetical protein